LAFKVITKHAIVKVDQNKTVTKKFVLSLVFARPYLTLGADMKIRLLLKGQIRKSNTKFSV
jgi:hypothetical protein